MVEHTVRVIVPFEGVIQPPWRPAPGQSGGNSGQRQHCSGMFFSSRANPAATGPGYDNESPGSVLSPLPAGGVAP
jgi:hypothetical protein